MTYEKLLELAIRGAEDKIFRACQFIAERKQFYAGDAEILENFLNEYYSVVDLKISAENREEQ